MIFDTTDHRQQFVAGLAEKLAFEPVVQELVRVLREVKPKWQLLQRLANLTYAAKLSQSGESGGTGKSAGKGLLPPTAELLPWRWRLMTEAEFLAPTEAELQSPKDVVLGLAVAEGGKTQEAWLQCAQQIEETTTPEDTLALFRTEAARFAGERRAVATLEAALGAFISLSVLEESLAWPAAPSSVEAPLSVREEMAEALIEHLEALDELRCLWRVSWAFLFNETLDDFVDGVEQLEIAFLRLRTFDPNEGPPAVQ